MSSQIMVRSTRHTCSLHLLTLMDSLTEQAVQDNLESNGVSERAVKKIKGFPKKSEDQHETLLAYRSTLLGNGYSPAELLVGRMLRKTIPDVQ